MHCNFFLPSTKLSFIFIYPQIFLQCLLSHRHLWPSSHHSTGSSLLSNVSSSSFSLVLHLTLISDSQLFLHLVCFCFALSVTKEKSHPCLVTFYQASSTHCWFMTKEGTKKICYHTHLVSLAQGQSYWNTYQCSYRLGSIDHNMMINHKESWTESVRFSFWTLFSVPIR